MDIETPEGNRVSVPGDPVLWVGEGDAQDPADLAPIRVPAFDEHGAALREEFSGFRGAPD